MAKLLIVSTEGTRRREAREALERLGHQTAAAESRAEALNLLANDEFEAMFVEDDLPDIRALELCAEVTGDFPGTPVVVLASHFDVATVSASIRVGARDVLESPLREEEARECLERLEQQPAASEPVRRLPDPDLAADPTEVGMLGEHPALQRLVERIARAAASEATVLIVGESGTGKELAARLLHRASTRRDRPLLTINCAALPELLLEGELFGHVRGAFTDAKSDRPGLFVAADGGTLFLDEVGAMPHRVQAKLLRALQERRVRPVGGDEEMTMDVRVVAATNDDLHEAVQQGRFRLDLLQQLDVVRLDVPPLRERGDDVVVLARVFAAEAAERLGRAPLELSPAAIEVLCHYPWPGNVRELRNTIDLAVTMAHGGVLEADDLPDRVRRRTAIPPAQFDRSLRTPLHEVERRHVRRVLRATGGCKTEAARMLGISRATLYRKLTPGRDSNGVDQPASRNT